MSSAPLKVYRSKISYFSGKLEAYLRYKEIPHELVDSSSGTTLAELARTVDFHCGVRKLPAIEMPGGQWLFDTTPTIQWLESQYTEHPVIPADPALRFLSLLIEDYGDEWLWRPSMWWRWVPKISRRTLGSIIMEEVYKTPFLWRYFAYRQLREWLWRDGMTKENSGKVRDMFFDELEFLEALFSEQPFILGHQPSVADFGYFGSMFRHFGNDPDSAEVMRTHGPCTYEWLARLWNLKSSGLKEEHEWIFPTRDYWNPLFDRIVNDYLPYLLQNADAFKDNKKRFDYIGKNHDFEKTKTTDYRVYCLEVLQSEYSRLDRRNKDKINECFRGHGDIEKLLTRTIVESGLRDFFTMPKDSLQGKHFGVLRRTTLFMQPRN